MRCNSRTMLTVGLAMGLAGAFASFTVPAAHAFLLAGTPLLVALICAISMLLMMKATSGGKKDQAVEIAEPKPAPVIVDAVPDKA